MTQQPNRRERLPHDVAKARYLAMGVTEVLEAVRARAHEFDLALNDPDDHPTFDVGGAIGLVTADAVAQRAGKTRGAVTNIWGSQAAFQRALLVELLTNDSSLGAIPDRATTEDLAPRITLAESVDAFAHGELERGPQPDLDLDGLDEGQRWAFAFLVELSYFPFALWSEELRRHLRDANEAYLAKLVSDFYEPGMRGLRREPAQGLSYEDLALVLYALTMGFWLVRTYAPDLTDRRVPFRDRSWTLFAHAVEVLIEAFTVSATDAA